MNKSGKYLVWTVLSVMGAFALGYIALNRGEQINALWIVVASVCVYLIAYRFYGLYIAKNVLALDPTRMTPAVRHNDGVCQPLYLGRQNQSWEIVIFDEQGRRCCTCRLGTAVMG